MSTADTIKLIERLMAEAEANGTVVHETIYRSSSCSHVVESMLVTDDNQVQHLIRVCTLCGEEQ